MGVRQMLGVREMKVVEVEELPKKITWVICPPEPIHGGQHKVYYNVGYIECAKHKASVKRGVKIGIMEPEGMLCSD